MVLARNAAAGRGLYIPLLPFPASRILLLKNPAFVPQLTSQNPPVLLPRKSVCCHTLPHRRVRRQPLSRVSRKQRYNTLDFAKQNRVPTGMLRAPIGNPAAKRYSLCNPSFSSQVYVQTAKGSLHCLLRKCKRQSVPMRSGLPFCRQFQFYHRARNDKIKIDDDAIHGYTVIASLNGI